MIDGMETNVEAELDSCMAAGSERSKTLQDIALKLWQQIRDSPCPRLLDSGLTDTIAAGIQSAMASVEQECDVLRQQIRVLTSTAAGLRRESSKKTAMFRRVFNVFVLGDKSEPKDDLLAKANEVFTGLPMARALGPKRRHSGARREDLAAINKAG